MKCPASDNGTCQLVIALGERCDGHSRKCKMRPAVEAQHELSDEERLEGLEQLAKEMLRDQALMAFTARKEGAWETVEWIEGCMKESRKRLAALEVSLDD